MDSSVGFCDMKYYGSTIGEALGWNCNDLNRRFDPGRVELLRRLTRHRMHHPEEKDNIFVFVKPEPHKLSKVAAGRLRLISAVSLVDTMVDRVMLRWLMETAMENICQTPVMLGWSPLRGGYLHMLDLFKGCKTRGLDKTAWDWTVSGWLLETVKEVIKELAVGANDFWLKWLDDRWEHLFCRAVFQFRDNTVVAQPGWGLMKSGCYLTILINSIGQLIYHAMALKRLSLPLDYRRFVAIGDDVTVEDFPEFEEYGD